MHKGGRLDHIDGLRGLAALAVVVQHAAQFVQDEGPSLWQPLLATANLGRFGVILFFLISGLVVPFSFRGEAPLRHFAISRGFRLFPAFWLSIPVLACIPVLVYGHTVTMPQLLANVTMFPGPFGEVDIGPGYWSLRFEVLFYVLTALLFWRRMLGDAALNGIIVLAFLAVSVQPVITGGAVTFFPYMLATFFLGMLLRRCFIEGDAKARRWALALVPAAIAAALAMSGFVHPLPENANPYLAPLPLALGMTLPTVVLVLVLWRRPVLPKWALWLGSISYSVYLFQDVGLLGLRVLLLPGDWPLGYVAAVIALTLGIATLVHRWVERPMIALGRRLAERKAPAMALPSA